MKSAYSFDMVHGTQEVFRVFLEALAHPGEPFGLNRYSAGFPRYGQWLAPAVTLLDNETGFFWDGAPEIGREIRFLSGSLPVSLEQADFVFLSCQADPARILSVVRRGTFTDPHDSALLLIAVQGGLEHTAQLNGPGVPPEGRRIRLCSTEVSWFKAREDQGFEYPCGVELVFLREDFSIIALTRKVSITWLM
ncbi:MAG: phosphonate C-P lyase system protein PhnH [Spirochaetales bacterium]|nr:phosphonate C-P lyase system protein PhnH [Spirochaetales bacterium]